MIYLRLSYYIFVIVLAFLYYIIPLKSRWLILLLGSVSFYVCMQPEPAILLTFFLSVIIAYISGLILQKSLAKSVRVKKIILTAGIFLSACPLILSKIGNLITNSFLHCAALPWIIPLGLSFYTMSIISYLVDIYREKHAAETNLLKFTLFVSFFPLIIQGPIHRYEQLAPQLFKGSKFDSRKITKGIHLIIWGFFLKLMIADKAAIIVDTVFGNPSCYTGAYIWVAIILYSIQLYADFMACVMISRGVCRIFGIEAINNFNHPYLATSIKDFWRRWHISLSLWLRDYIYIPLGGNKKGKLRKYCNITLTFLVSGLWHGSSLSFILWGLIHAVYQITGEITYPLRDRLYNRIGLEQNSFYRKLLQSAGVYFFGVVAMVVFRAGNLKTGFYLYYSMFTASNFHILFDNSLLNLGLCLKELNILALSICTLILVSVLQEKKHISISNWILKQPCLVRYGIYYFTIVFIWIFGTYGYGFNISDFIYGGF